MHTLKPGRWRPRALSFVWLLLAIEFLDELVFGAREAAWPLIRDDLDLSYAQIGLLIGAPNITSAFIEPALGILGDTGWRRALIAWGGVAFAAALFAFAAAPGFVVLLGASLLLYPASGAFVSLSQVALIGADPTRAERLMARWTLAGSVGVVLGPIMLGLFVLTGAGWQRCRVHFMRNALSLVPKKAQQMIGATIRTVFAQPDAAGAHEQWRRVADGFRGRFGRLAELMDEAEEDVLAYAAFPAEHWRQVWSNNPLERLNKEVKRRTNVVGIFPNEAAVVRLVGAVLCEQHDEWQVASRRYFSAESLEKLEQEPRMMEQPMLANR